MSVGLEVLDANGKVFLSDKQLVVVSNAVSVPAGVSYLPLKDDFIALGIRGSELGSFSSVIRGSRIEVYSSRAASVMVFSAGIPVDAKNDFGLEVYNKDGQITFASAKNCFKILGVGNLNTADYKNRYPTVSGPSLPYLPDNIYCVLTLRDVFHAVVIQMDAYEVRRHRVQISHNGSSIVSAIPHISTPNATEQRYFSMQSITFGKVGEVMMLKGF